MKKNQVEQRVQSAFNNATPNNFQSIQQDCRRIPQQTTRRTTQMTKTWKFATIALALILVIGAVFGTVDLTQNAYAATVTIDVNPSISIQIDGKQRVVSVIANNEDAEIIIADIKDDLVGVKINIAVKAIMGEMLAKGYISEIANSVLVSVDPEKGQWAYDEIVKVITDEIDVVMTEQNIDCSLMSQHLKKNEQVEAIAEKYNITIGKAQLIYKLLNTENNTYEEAKLAELTVNELAILLGGKCEGEKGFDHKGKASDKAYITKEAALTAVVDYLNANSVVEGLTEELTVEAISAMEGFEIDLDFDNHTMVYEVEFEYNSYEYEVEVDATTGLVVDYEKSIEDDDDDDDRFDDDKLLTEEDKAQMMDKIKEVVDGKLGEGWFDKNKHNMEIEFDDNELEIEFEFEGKEYEFEMNVCGKVTEHMPGGRPEHGSQHGDGERGLLTQQEALDIILNHAGLPLDSALSDCEIELEISDKGNMAYYEIEFELDGFEYEAKVNAKSGTITKYSREAD